MTETAWGPWRLHKHFLVHDVSGFDVHLPTYHLTAASVLERIVQVARKPWADAATVSGYLAALEDVLPPTVTVCPNGRAVTISARKVERRLDTWTAEHEGDPRLRLAPPWDGADRWIRARLEREQEAHRAAAREQDMDAAEEAL